MTSESRDECREALLQLRIRRRAEDLLHAPAEPASRKDGEVPNSVYHHTAECLELAYVTAGEVRVATPAEVFRLIPGRLLVIERGVSHSELTPRAGRDHDIYWFHLDQTSGYLTHVQHSPPQTRTFPYWHMPGRTNVESIGNALAYELAARDWGYPAAAAGILDYLTCILVRRVLRGAVVPRPPRESPAISADPRRTATIQAALDYCDANFQEGVTQADVAKGLGCSPKHLSRLISSHLGHSLSDHLRNLRMAEARHLLGNTDLTVRSVARAVGYRYPAHFTRAFTRIVGLSPEGFRRRLSGSDSEPPRGQNGNPDSPNGMKRP